jgi:hypothetical protein
VNDRHCERRSTGDFSVNNNVIEVKQRSWIDDVKREQPQDDRKREILGGDNHSASDRLLSKAAELEHLEVKREREAVG